MPCPVVILVDTQYGRLGQSAQLDDRLAGQTVLSHTVSRALRVPNADGAVLVHGSGQSLIGLLDESLLAQSKVKLVEHPLIGPSEQSVSVARLMQARKWSMTSWRGGLGFSTVFDELLHAEALLAGYDAVGATSGYVVRGDWCVFDTELASQQLERHLAHPNEMKLVFTQSPPGLAGVAVHREVFEQLAETEVGFGRMLGYNPFKPTLDPISREVCLPIPAEVRDCAKRFIYDTHRSRVMLGRLADQLGQAFEQADGQAITDGVRALEQSGELDPYANLPQQVTVELTPIRKVSSEFLPQGHVKFQRGDMLGHVFDRVLSELSEVDDAALILGGLGDAMLHPDWQGMIERARSVGLMGLGIETDLLCDQADVEQLASLDLDVVVVRFNADKKETYQTLMGPGGSPGVEEDLFSQVAENLQALIRLCQERRQAGQSSPWVCVELLKTDETLSDMESFFERWLRAGEMAVVRSQGSGCGLMPSRSPIPMAPPLREPCRQLGRRMTIHSDGKVALCDQDWLGRATLGDVQEQPLLTIWSGQRQTADAHREEQWTSPNVSLPLCGDCQDWYRP